MRVLIVSTAECAGGGAIAARRLMMALNKCGVQAKMLVRDKGTDSVTVARVGSRWPKVLERLELMLRLRLPLRRTWAYDSGRWGVDILSTREYREAQVVHLHWVNQGMLSLDALERMLMDNKRVVWTMHDEWPFRGIVHYSDDASVLPRRVARMDEAVLRRKREIFGLGRIRFVGCSRWITELGRGAMPGACVRHINNCVPQEVFCPVDRAAARRELGLPEGMKLVMFCSQRVTDERKGGRFMLEALDLLGGEDLGLVVVGKETLPATGARVFGMPYVEGERKMALLYGAVDCFVTPSLQDNLPNTIAEAMSCGTPCVGFDSGGIPEMIDHLRNGYVARRADSADLAEGIRYVLAHPELGGEALRWARRNYGESRVAEEYIRLYEE